MATLPKREKAQTATLTIKAVKIDTVNDRFHFTVEENEIIAQTNKEGVDEFTTSFSEGFACLLEDLMNNPLMQDIYIECMNNPIACNGVDKAMFILLQGLLNKQVTITRHFAHAGDIVRGYSMPNDKWVVDKMEVGFDIKLSDRLQSKFDKAVENIERNDDF